MANRLSAHELEEFLTHNFPRPLYLCDPIFPSGGSALLHGRAGLGKTQLALSLAIAVATGQPFLGYPCTQGPVGFIQVDTPEEVFQDRLRKAFSWGTADNPGLPPMMVVTSAYDQDVEQLLAKPPAAVEKLRDAQPSLIIVDSLSKTHTRDENEASSPRAVYAAWKHLFAECEQPPAFLFIHHDRKGTDGIEFAGDESYRGSVAWIANVDVGLHLLGTRDGMQLHFSKIRTADKQKPIDLTMDPETLLVNAPRNAEASIKALLRTVPTATQKDAVAFLISRRICGRTKAYEVARKLIPEKG